MIKISRDYNFVPEHGVVTMRECKSQNCSNYTKQILKKFS